MHTVDSLASHPDATVAGTWRIRSRNRKTGLVTAERTVKNVWTQAGLTALATAIYGGYIPPTYLVIDTFHTTPQTAVVAGDTVVKLAAQVDLAGDTQLVLGAGLASQEIVTYSSVTTGTGYYAYHLTAGAANAHPTTDPCTRQPTINDTMSSVINEIQYDSVNFPGLRVPAGGGYSSGTGNGTIQFYIPGPDAQGLLMSLGLADNAAVGGGTLHNHFVLGYNHNSTTDDLEIDGALTLTNA